MAPCAFCEIVAGRSPCRLVVRDEHTVAFLDIRPAAPGHVLVVPRVHARDVWEIPEASHRHVADAVHRVAALLRESLSPDGVNIKHSTGEAAGQDVFHFHVHVIPRWHGDGLRQTWCSELAPSHELDRVLARLTGTARQNRA